MRGKLRAVVWRMLKDSGMSDETVPEMSKLTAVLTVRQMLKVGTLPKVKANCL